MPSRSILKIDTSDKQHRDVSVELRDVGSASTASASTPRAPPPAPAPKKEKVKWRELPHKDQLTILVLARLAEPLVQTSLQSYMFFQLRSFDPSLSDATVSSQAGLLQASFSAAQTLTGVLWGRVADSYGRKTVLILGSLGTIISCLGFGMSRSFAFALMFRALGGLVNGNIPVMRTMISEIIKEKKYQARAFLLMPMCFNIGVILGPVMGGLLADLPGTYPHVFGPDSFFGGKTGVRWMMYWPYLAPNLLSAIIVTISLLTISLGLNETLDSVKDQPDRARLFGQRVVRAVCFWRKSHDYTRVAATEAEEGLLQSERDAEPDHPASATDVESKPATPKTPTAKKLKKKLPFRRIWTPNVLFTLLAHFTTAFHLGTFNNLWFIFLSADRYLAPAASPSPSTTTTTLNTRAIDPATYHPHLPFTFTGGLGMPPRLVGLAMAILGVIGITLQLLIYPRVNDRYGVLPPYRVFVAFFPLAYALAPYIATMPSSTPAPAPASGFWVWAALCIVLCIQVVGRTFVLPATMILINNCSPHPSVLGTIHGIAGSVGSGARTFGPAVAGYLFGVGLDVGVVGLAWWVLAGIAGFGVLSSRWVREGSGHEIKLEEEEEDEEEVEGVEVGQGGGGDRESEREQPGQAVVRGDGERNAVRT